MPYCCFISDLHLDASRPDITRALSSFLNEHRNCDALYILGDLFETWVGDDDDSALAAEVRVLLRSFTHAGAALHILHGNRDFLLGPQFCQDTGANLLEDGTTVDLYGTPTLLMHGDSLCTDDVDYQALRQEVRQPQWQANFLAQALPQRQEQAAALRNLSREALAGKQESITDVNAQAVQQAMEAHGVTRLVHGHTHRAGRYPCAAGERLVLGDWHDHSCWGRASAAGLDLIDFDIIQ